MITDAIIKMLTLDQYLELLNKQGSNLVTDKEHWAEYGVNTAIELADYLDAEHAYNMRKESW